MPARGVPAFAPGLLRGGLAPDPGRVRAIHPLVEPLSLDEAFLDVGDCERLFGPAPAIARRIKREIRDELSLVASVGVAPNKFLAKLASDLDKPDGLVVVPADGVEAFLEPLPVGRLWGVGRAAGAVVAGLGVETIGDIRRLPEAVLSARLGKLGERLSRLSRGEDERAVTRTRRRSR